MAQGRYELFWSSCILWIIQNGYILDQRDGKTEHGEAEIICTVDDRPVGGNSSAIRWRCDIRSVHDTLHGLHVLFKTVLDSRLKGREPLLFFVLTERFSF